jgi:hypothetical protein
MFTEDLEVFLNADEHAVAALYKAGGVGAGVAVNVIFNESGGEVLGITTTKPEAIGKSSDFAAMTNTDTLTIGANVYRIVDANPIDDGAFTNLKLELQ